MAKPPKFHIGQEVVCIANDNLRGPQLKIGSIYVVSDNWVHPVRDINCISVVGKNQQWAWFEDDFAPVLPDAEPAALLSEALEGVPA